jgi:hypothetical protein
VYGKVQLSEVKMEILWRSLLVNFLCILFKGCKGRTQLPDLVEKVMLLLTKKLEGIKFLCGWTGE